MLFVFFFLLKFSRREFHVSKNSLTTSGVIPTQTQNVHLKYASHIVLPVSLLFAVADFQKGLPHLTVFNLRFSGF